MNSHGGKKMKSECFWQWHRSNLRMALAIVALPVLLLTGSSRAQDSYIYPTKGQSQEQQDRGRYECHSWAVKQTGFDPSRPQTAASDAHPASNQPCHRRGTLREAPGEAPHLERWVVP
jgi:hypothetical protein